MSNQIPDFESFEPEDEKAPTTPGLPSFNREDETDDEFLAEIFGEAVFPSFTKIVEEELADDLYPPVPPVTPRRPTLASQSARTTFQWGMRATAAIDPHRSAARRDVWSAALAEELELMEQVATAAAVAKNLSEAMTLAATLPVLAIRLAPQSYRALWGAIPALVQGVAGLTRLLYGRLETRPLIRQLPTILENTVVDLTEWVADGRPVSLKIAATILARQAGVIIQEQQRRSAPPSRRRAYDTKGQRNGHGYAR